MMTAIERFDVAVGEVTTETTEHTEKRPL